MPEGYFVCTQPDDVICERDRPTRCPVAWFFLFACLLQTVSTGAPRWWSAAALVPNAVWCALASPSLLGLAMIAWFGGLPGIRAALSKLTPWSAGRAWPMLLVSVLLPLACLPLAMLLLAANGVHVPALSDVNLPAYFRAALIGKTFAGPGIYEEIGWRGFALPLLQRRYSALTSSVIIGVVWALWHVPLFVYARPFPLTYLTLFIPQVINYSIILTWVYNTTRGSLFAVILLHGAINARQYLADWSNLPDTATTQLLSEAPFLLVAAVLVRCFGPADLSRRQRVVSRLRSPRRMPAFRRADRASSFDTRSNFLDTSDRETI